MRHCAFVYNQVINGFKFPNAKPKKVKKKVHNATISGAGKSLPKTNKTHSLMPF